MGLTAAINAPAHQPAVNFEVGLLRGEKRFLGPIPHINIRQNANDLSNWVGQTNEEIKSKASSIHPPPQSVLWLCGLLSMFGGFVM
jgi:hypothetical protein